MWSSDLCVARKKEKKKKNWHPAFCLSGNCLWLMIPREGVLGKGALLCVYMCVYVWAAECALCALSKKKKKIEWGQFAWDWCTAPRSASRSSTMRLLKPCLSPLYGPTMALRLPLSMCSGSLSFTGDCLECLIHRGSCFVSKKWMLAQINMSPGVTVSVCTSV